MSSKLNRIPHFKGAVGIDLSEELIETNKDKSTELKVDNAEKLKFGDIEIWR